MAMNCPRCGMALRLEAYEGVEIDRCGDCQGVWLDDGELRQIVRRRDARLTPAQVEAVRAEIKKHAAAGGAESRVNCPKCGSPMTKSDVSGVLIDRCRSRCGVWLDAGELEKVQALAKRWQSLWGLEARRGMAKTPSAGMVVDLVASVVEFLVGMVDWAALP